MRVTRQDATLPRGLAPVLRRVLGRATAASVSWHRHDLPSPGTTWSQQQEITTTDGAQGDNFGVSVALSGDTALVGAPGNHLGGAAYVFVRRGRIWSQQAELKDPAPRANTNSFGFAVALSGDTALVGAYGLNNVTGAAYVFVRSGTTWTQQARLVASDGASGDQFGYAVALSGDTALVGAIGLSNFIHQTGAAYVFMRSGTTWTQQAKLIAADGVAGDQFGYAVALSGNLALIGADQNYSSSIGAAYVFVRSGATWAPQAKLTAADGKPGDLFGASVALSGTTALVGANAFANGASAGAAYVFGRSGSTWIQQARLTAADGKPGDQFGQSVALSGSTAVVGANEYNNHGTGAAYVFGRSGSTWIQQARLTASDGGQYDQFGESIALSGNTALVGANVKNNYTGAAYVFGRS